MEWPSLQRVHVTILQFAPSLNVLRINSTVNTGIGNSSETHVSFDYQKGVLDGFAFSQKIELRNYVFFTGTPLLFSARGITVRSTLYRITYKGLSMRFKFIIHVTSRSANQLSMSTVQTTLNKQILDYNNSFIVLKTLRFVIGKLKGMVPVY